MSVVFSMKTSNSNEHFDVKQYMGTSFDDIIILMVYI